MNKVLLTGRITKDPEIRYTSSNIPSVNFSIACNRDYKDQSGQRQADFINCVAWRNQADFISRYVHKGNLLAVEGRIQTRSYQNQQGITQYVTEVVVESVENLTPRQSNDNMQNNNYNRPNNNNNYYNNQYQEPSYGDFNTDIVDENDLPF